MSLYKSYPTEEEALDAAQKYVAENGSIEFDGMNCNDYKDEEDGECYGWDGESRRCSCGNRRVSWCVEKNPDGSFYARAEAW